MRSILRTLSNIFLLTVLTWPSDLVCGDVQLNHLSTVYLPAAKEKKPDLGEGAVEQIAYDPVKKIIYASGAEVYHVIDASNPRDLKLKYTKYEDDVDLTDIDVCDGYVFITVRDHKNPQNGVLRLFKSFDENRVEPLELVKEFPVGTLPDMLNVLEDCRTVIIADEGEAYQKKGKFVDPEGHVTIVRFPEGVERAKDKSSITLLGFESFNDRYRELQPSGVRFVYRGKNNKLSNDLEPEYILVDEHANTAYVILQENNAIAEVDLTKGNITSLRGLGYKTWGSLDASDKDGGILITYWPIRAWYNPDGAKFHRWQNRRLVFTANEGDSKEYPEQSFKETVRGASILKSDLGPEIHEIVKSAINDETKLGRLQFSRHEGKDYSGKYNALYTFGARSFSIWDVTPGSGDDGSPVPLVFDSGSQFEELIALHCPHLFNRGRNDRDERSSSKGPEPESLALAEIHGRLYIFIGLERPGTIFVYSLGDDITRPRFENIFCEGIPDSSKSMKEMFNDRDIFAADPEDIRYYPPAKSPTGRPLLMVAGTVSGTVTLLEVQVSGEDQGEGK